MKLIELVKRQSARLTQAGVSFGHGTDNAFDEAVWLVLWKLGLPLDELDGVADRILSVDEAATIHALVGERIATRKPAAYLTREAWLQGVPFYIDERAIVPRSLIAEVIADGTLDAWLPTHMHSVLDLCTGSGSLAVLAAMAWPEVNITATDLSADALAVARINVDKHGLGKRISLHAGDGLAAIAGRRFDLILCNPPYVNALAMAALPAEYQAEPALALAGGYDGMDFIRTLIAHAARHLTEHAVLVLEIGNEWPHFDAALPTVESVWLPTSAGEDQVLLITREALALHQEDLRR